MDQIEYQMARNLIDHVKQTHTPRLALLEDRITAARVYMEQVGRPTMTTLSHIEAILNGRRDDQLPFYNASDRAQQIREEENKS